MHVSGAAATALADGRPPQGAGLAVDFPEGVGGGEGPDEHVAVRLGAPVVGGDWGVVLTLASFVINGQQLVGLTRHRLPKCNMKDILATLKQFACYILNS